MSKKHFIALANEIKNERMHDGGKGCVLIETLADFCQSQNPRFNRQRWLDYIEGKCGPNGGAVKA